MKRVPKVIVVSAIGAGGMFGGLERYVIQLKQAARREFGDRVSFLDVPFDERVLYRDGESSKLSTQLISADIIHANDFMAAWLCAINAPAKPLVTAFHLLHQHFTYRSAGPHLERIQAAERQAIRMSTLLVANSRATEIDLINAGADAAKIVVVRNGVSSEFFEVTRPERGPAMRLLFAGRLVEQKGADQIPELLSALDDSSVDWTLEIAGTGPLEDEIRNLSAPYQVCCNLLGQVEADEMPQVYARNDATISMSRYEPFGMFALESIATGTPVVGSIRGGMKEFCIDSRNALAVDDPHPARGIARCIEAIWDGRETLPSGPGLRDTVTDLTWERTVAGLRAAYARAA